MNYQKRFLRLIGNVEKMIVTGILVGFILLAISQSLLTIPVLRTFLVETVKLEGIASK